MSISDQVSDFCVKTQHFQFSSTIHSQKVRICFSLTNLRNSFIKITAHVRNSNKNKKKFLWMNAVFYKRKILSCHGDLCECWGTHKRKIIFFLDVKKKKNLGQLELRKKGRNTRKNVMREFFSVWYFFFNFQLLKFLETIFS